MILREQIRKFSVDHSHELGIELLTESSCISDTEPEIMKFVQQSISKPVVA